MKPLTHDVTTLSTGLFTDTASGGLKHDFHLMGNSSTLPSEYQGKGVYVSRLGMTAANAPSDPRWESLHEFSRLYRETSKVSLSAGAPVLKAQAPERLDGCHRDGLPGRHDGQPHSASRRGAAAHHRESPDAHQPDRPRPLQNLPEPVTGPLTAAQKANGMHGPQDGYFRSTRYDYDLHLLYAPIVTLHNPYNVALEFNSLKVEFVHVPFAMKVYRSGQAQTAGLIPMEQMTARQ